MQGHSHKRPQALALPQPHACIVLLTCHAFILLRIWQALSPEAEPSARPSKWMYSQASVTLKWRLGRGRGRAFFEPLLAPPFAPLLAHPFAPLRAPPFGSGP